MNSFEQLQKATESLIQCSKKINFRFEKSPIFDSVLIKKSKLKLLYERIEFLEKENRELLSGKLDK